MENLLEINLNEIATKHISEKIEYLEKQLEDTRNKNIEQYNEIASLKKQVDNSKVALGLLDHLRDEFSKIKQSEERDGGWFDSKEKNQFVFIENVLLNIFNIKKEANGWYCHRYEGSLATHLAVNFYSNKDVVINLLKIFMKDSVKAVSFIDSFKMPFDYSKDEVIRYVKNPEYNTNGCIFGINQYWVERGAGKSNMPHDLIMKNPFILNDDVFELLLNSIRKKVANFYYLFALPKHNKNISKEQIVALGECLVSIGAASINQEDIKMFISDNLKNFNNNTLDFLYNLVRSDNQFNTLHWEKFPNEYQMRFLKSKKLDEVLRLITCYSCTWTTEQKEVFLREFTAIN